MYCGRVDLTQVQERLEGVHDINRAIDIVAEEETPCDRGPYSHSRLNTCNYQFYKKYIEGAPENNTTRFGRAYGSAVHKAAEYDVLMRVQKDEDKWLDIDSFIDFVVNKHPEFAEFQGEIQDTIENFRLNFDVNSRRYLSSEEKMGLDFSANPADFDGDDCWFRGVVDYISIDENGVARVVDYKNYPRVHKYKELSNLKTGVSSQLMGYASMVFHNYPMVSAVKPEIYYFRYGTTRTLMQRDEDDEWEERKVYPHDIDNWWKFNQRRMLAVERRKEEYFEPQPDAKNCQYCSYIHDCPVWEDTDPEDEYLAEDDETAEEMLDKLIVIEEHRKRLRSNLKEFVKKRGNPLEKDGGEIFFGWKPTTKKSADIEEMIDICQEAGFDKRDFVKSTKGRIKKLKRALQDAGEDGLVKRLEKSINNKQKSRFKFKK